VNHESSCLDKLFGAVWELARREAADATLVAQAIAVVAERK
jgi:hypothetical protein